MFPIVVEKGVDSGVKVTDSDVMYCTKASEHLILPVWRGSEERAVHVSHYFYLVGWTMYIISDSSSSISIY